MGTTVDHRDAIAKETTRFIIGIVVAIIALGFTGYRCIMLTLGHQKSGQFLKSPNGQFEAYAWSIGEEDFWGRRRRYYEFELSNKMTGESIKTVRMDPVPGQRYFQMRGDDRIISWSPDSSEATYAFQGIELKLKTRP